jgi:hypothetical protein
VSAARSASTAPSIASVPVLDRSRRSTLAPLNKQKVNPKWGEKAKPVEKALEGTAPGSERISILGAVRLVLGVKPKTVSDYVPAPFTVYSNPYKARKAWPPNFDHLHPKHQFHYEKTYRRRMKLKYARPRFTMWTKLIQWTLIWGITIYWVFIMQMEQNGQKVGTMWENVSGSDAQSPALTRECRG